MTEFKNRKKLAATALVSCLALGGIFGTYANLNQTITDGAETHSITADSTLFGFQYTVDSGVINKDISLNEPASTETVKSENIGDIPAHGVFYVDPASIPEVDLNNPIYDETAVTVVITTEDATETWNGTLGEFFNTAFVTDNAVDPAEENPVVITITPQTEGGWSSMTPADAIDLKFGTMFTYNQISSGTSPLLDYAQANGTAVGTGAWTLPVADLGNITY